MLLWIDDIALTCLHSASKYVIGKNIFVKVPIVKELATEILHLKSEIGTCLPLEMSRTGWNISVESVDLRLT